MRTTLTVLLLLGCAGTCADTTIPLFPGACHYMEFRVPADQQVMHFNADDLEQGNAEKGITGIGDGDWRLQVRGHPVFLVETLAYMRTKRDGFLTALNGSVVSENGALRVWMFNPGSNTNQRSLLRLVNTSDTAVTATVRGVDDHGKEGGPVTVTLTANGAETLTARQLEDSGTGDGNGKWRLTVTAPQPVIVMSLMDTPTGHLANLSSYPDSMTVPLFPAASAKRPADVLTGCRMAQNWMRQGPAAAIDASGGARQVSRQRKGLGECARRPLGMAARTARDAPCSCGKQCRPARPDSTSLALLSPPDQRLWALGAAGCPPEGNG